jgi:putative PIN family toxin of toxin-antitoxin system
MRVVLDTNILFSALISPHGAPDVIYRAWRSARFELVSSRAQLDEIRRASRYPKLQAVLQPAKVGVMINNLQRALVLEQLPRHFEADDPDDAFAGHGRRGQGGLSGDRRPPGWPAAARPPGPHPHPDPAVFCPKS